MKEKQDSKPRKVNTEILRSLRDGILAPEDLVFLDPQELFDVLSYLSRLPFNVDASRPTPTELNMEWGALCMRIGEEVDNNKEAYSDLRSVTRALFGTSMSSVTLYLMAEIMTRYFSELTSILRIFNSSESLIDSIHTSMKDIVSQLENNAGTNLIKTPLEIGMYKLSEAKELKKTLDRPLYNPVTCLNEEGETPIH